MTKQRDKLLDDALGLAPRDRAQLAVALLASLDGEADVDAEDVWADEIEHRADRARTGEDPGRPWEEVRDCIRDELAKR